MGLKADTAADWKRLQEKREHRSTARPSQKYDYATNEAVKRRYLHQGYRSRGGKLRPFSLPFYELLKEAELLKGSTSPPGCAGPDTRDWLPASPHMCRQDKLCGCCWDRRSQAGALSIMGRQLHGGEVWSFSQSLPAIRTEPKAVKEARDAFAKILTKRGWKAYSIYVHTFGDPPWEGPKGHLDGFFGALPDSDPAPIIGTHISGTDPDQRHAWALHPEIQEELAHLWRSPVAHHPAVIAAKQVDVEAKDYVYELWTGAKYAGRQTFPTLRILAGQANRQGTRFRMTNIDGAMVSPPKRRRMKPRPKKALETWVNPRGGDGYFGLDEVLAWCQTACEWDLVMGRPKQSNTKPVHEAYKHQLEGSWMHATLHRNRLQYPAWLPKPARSGRQS